MYTSSSSPVAGACAASTCIASALDGAAVAGAAAATGPATAAMMDDESVLLDLEPSARLSRWSIRRRDACRSEQGWGTTRGRLRNAHPPLPSRSGSADEALDEANAAEPRAPRRVIVG